MTQREKYPKTKRLRTRRDFSRVHHNHLSFSHNQISINYRANKKSTYRLGIVLTRKNGPSVLRNKCKRWCREVFRKTFSEKPANCDIVIRVKGTLSTVTFEEVVEAFRLLQQVLI